MPKTYLTPGDVARLIGVSRQMVLKYMDSGRIPSIVIAGRRVVDKRHAKKPPPRRPGPKPQGHNPRHASAR